MIKITTLFIIFLTVSKYSNCQEFNLTYKVLPKNILEGKTNVPEQGIYLVKEGIKYAKKEEFILKINDTLSFFFKINKLISHDDPLVDVYKGIAKSFTDFKDNVSFNYKKNYIIFNKTILYETYTVKQKPVEFNWKIKEDFKEILGFKAQKAEGQYTDIITGKVFDIQAWFINEISIPTGPDIFIGLPGLIIEVDLPKSKVILTEINETEDAGIEIDFNKKMLSKTEFEDVLKGLNSQLSKNRYN